MSDDLSESPMEFIGRARDNCKMTIKNTAAGMYLGTALMIIESLQNELISVYQTDAEKIATLTAENDKLRRDCALRDLELAEVKAALVSVEEAAKAAYQAAVRASVGDYPTSPSGASNDRTRQKNV